MPNFFVKKYEIITIFTKNMDCNVWKLSYKYLNSYIRINTGFIYENNNTNYYLIVLTMYNLG
jgi:hypothetical protein